MNPFYHIIESHLVIDGEIRARYSGPDLARIRAELKNDPEYKYLVRVIQNCCGPSDDESWKCPKDYVAFINAVRSRKGPIYREISNVLIYAIHDGIVNPVRFMVPNEKMIYTILGPDLSKAIKATELARSHIIKDDFDNKKILPNNKEIFSNDTAES